MKRFAIIVTSALLALGFMAESASAATGVVTVQEFSQYLKYLKSYSPDLVRGGSSQLDGGTLYLKNEQRLEFPDDILAKLLAIAEQNSMAWKDTYLAEEIRTAGSLSIESVEGLYSGSTLLGYRMTYSQPAYDLDSCQNERLSSCHIGELRESAFVSPDFSHVELDKTALAQLQF